MSLKHFSHFIEPKGISPVSKKRALYDCIIAMVVGASYNKKHDTKDGAIRIPTENNYRHEQTTQNETPWKKSKEEKKNVQKMHGIDSQFFEFFGKKSRRSDEREAKCCTEGWKYEHDENGFSIGIERRSEVAKCCASSKPVMFSAVVFAFPFLWPFRSSMRKSVNFGRTSLL